MEIAEEGLYIDHHAYGISGLTLLRSLAPFENYPECTEERQRGESCSIAYRMYLGETESCSIAYRMY